MFSYATGTFIAGVAVLAVVTIPLAGLQSATPAGSSAPGPITGTGEGIGPHHLLAGYAVALALLIPVSLAVGWLVAGRFLKPLRAVTATAKEISAGNLHQRLDLGEPIDELTELGFILDDLFARLEASFTAQRHFVANASHELRTPLAGLRTLLEVSLADPDADSDSLRRTCEEVLVLGGHQERLIDALLTLAISERGTARRDPIDLAHVVQETVATQCDQASERGIDLTEHLTPAATVGDPRLIESLVTNLIENAIRHNHRHGHGHAEISTHSTRTQAVLTVTNSGPVILDNQIQRLFQPFQRLAPDRDSSHEGHGLGLTIVNAVAIAHNATITTDAPTEGGLSVTVRFAHTDRPASARAPTAPEQWGRSV